MVASFLPIWYLREISTTGPMFLLYSPGADHIGLEPAARAAQNVRRPALPARRHAGRPPFPHHRLSEGILS